MTLGATLHDVRVLDLSWLAPGPYATMHLGDLGADVIKIERPGAGDYLREMMPDAYYTLNRNKRSVSLDLKRDDDREVFLHMTAQADVIVEGFRPGVVGRLGVAYDDVVAHNPAIVYCSITGYGQDGPWRDMPGHDLAYVAMGGGLSIRSDIEFPPVRPSLPIADLGTGMVAAMSILAALFDARATGTGDYIDLSMVDAVTSWAAMRLGTVLQSGEPPLVLLSALNKTYVASDGRSIALAVVEDKLFDAFCRCMGLDEWLTDERFATMRSRVAHADDMFPVIRDRIAERTRDEWVEIFQEAGIAAAPVLGPDEVFDNPYANARGLVEEVGSGRHYRYPAKFSNRETSIRRVPPALGEHSREVLEEFAVDRAHVERLCGPGT